MDVRVSTLLTHFLTWSVIICVSNNLWSLYVSSHNNDSQQQRIPDKSKENVSQLLPLSDLKCQCVNVTDLPFFMLKHVGMIRDECCMGKSFKSFFLFFFFQISFWENTFLYLWALFLTEIKFICRPKESFVIFVN